MPRITFLGATQCVTGSKFLVEAAANGRTERLLVDCGLFQGKKELRLRNWDALPLDPATLDHVVLTHAHIDHTGYLPRLVRDGFRGPIYSNAATRELCSILLPDSARLQEEDAEHASFKGYSKHDPPLPLYTEEEALEALTRFALLPDDTQPHRLSSAFSLRLLTAGHILGSSSIELTIRENGRSVVIHFSGDLGRYDQPILNDPAPPPRCDYLVCESTYGNREHPADSPHDALAEVISRVAQRGGAAVIPAFAVGRTQTLLYILRQLEDWQRIPRLPVYVDSPMAARVTDLYLSHKDSHDLEYQRDAASQPLKTAQIHVTRSVEESKQINKANFPCVIISASGMATGGRILHHLARRLPDSRNAILLAGYQAEGTRGRALLEGARTLRIHGEDVPVKAEIVHLTQFSAHAGRSELLRWLDGLPQPPKKTFLVHGEPDAMQSFASALRDHRRWPSVSLPEYQQSFDLA
jgi:metallo-beta-lactamase family protein